MKNIKKISAVVMALLFAVSQSAFAKSVSSQAFPISAGVGSVFTLDVHLFKNSATGPTGTELTSLDFGQLQLVTFAGTGADAGKTFKELRSSDTGTNAKAAGIVALVTANTQGAPYNITSNGTILSSGTATIPAGASVESIVYSPADNNGQAVTGTLGTSGSWVNGAKTVYVSNAAADIRTVQAIFSVTGDPAAGATTVVPVNQAAGTYQGQVTFTLTA